MKLHHEPGYIYGNPKSHKNDYDSPPLASPQTDLG